jgi:ketosteroid isomerase-like protein
MSEQNVELVLKAMNAFSTGDIEAAMALYASDVVVYAVPEWPDDPVWRGYDGVRKVSAVWTGGFEDVSWEVYEIRDLEERLLIRADLIGRIKDSGAPLRQSYGIVVSDFRDGTIGQIRFFLTWQEALKAVGLAQ